MITSKDGKTYDTADGSEQPHAASEPPASRESTETSGERADLNRSNDDGAAPRGGNPAATPPGPTERKPLWSVLSVRALARAIGLSKAPETVARHEREQSDRDRASSDRAHERRAAEAARRAADPNRNAWENT